ncbi:MAG: SusC/RagA family TonB-linked outer membrane protein [Candidatus Pseudobacter hemicellulosilyticus]|uniref:SusC/RagA family TonB-linked outer membrane protein n=1 Tax=Candidatus Pseudobacter hemicellulosilyticus TaxID=3121375 RepID=A0AAJ5WWW5_9BACT|nr:MAG: SusC/RagA family TonB-linked outer membrane protein [Pseudobacter sp.]
MKWLLLLMLMLGACPLPAQTGNGRLTLSLQRAPLKTAFDAIHRQTGMVFIFAHEQLTNTQRVTLQVKQWTLQRVLDTLFRNQPLTYRVVDDQYIVIQEKRLAPPAAPVTAPDTPAILAQLNGEVLDADGQPIAGATVALWGSTRAVATDGLGRFVLRHISANGLLLVSTVGYETRRVRVAASGRQTIRLTQSPQPMEEVTILSTGYEKLTPEKTTGAYFLAGASLVNRRPGPTILDRIEHLAPGLLFNHGAPDALLIRGRSTIHGDAAPLVVVDNFPYDGDLNNINPADVDNITVLRDAAAASIWGARAGNGVIVISTRKGQQAQQPKIGFNSTFTVTGKPDLYHRSIIPAADYIELEKFLFDRGAYDLDEQRNIYSMGHPPFTPVVEWLLAKRKGSVSAAQADSAVEAMKRLDTRDDLDRYFYQPGLLQQYALNVSGGGPSLNYYLSAGWDRNRPTTVGDFISDRITLRSQNTFKVSSRFQVEAGLHYTYGLGKTANNPGLGIGSAKGIYPYADLVNEAGQGLPLVQGLRQAYVDTAGGGQLLNWTYIPLDDIPTVEGRSRMRDFMINTTLRYRLLPGLHTELRYQFQNQVLDNDVLYTMQSYWARNLINDFTQVNPDGSVWYPIPRGGIMDRQHGETLSQQARVQLNFKPSLGEQHQLTALAGWEIRDLLRKASSDRVYGYNRSGSLASPLMDYTTEFPRYSTLNIYNTGILKSRIPNVENIDEKRDRFLSFFANAAYTWRKRYTFSVSGRHDAANLFGAQTNKMRGLPLWSVGGSWQLDQEKFYRLSWLPGFRLRATYGYSGNITRETTGVTTIAAGRSGNTGFEMATILNPPNARLRWEQVRQLNIGVDLASAGQRVSGSLEFYRKEARDLLGGTRADPTLGVGTVLSANVASMRGYGMDLLLQTRNLTGAFKWNTTVLFSTTRNKVTNYLLPLSNRGADYLGGINPVVGKPVYALFSYYWGGLDPATGDPRGYTGKELSKDYDAILNNTRPDSMQFHGALQPEKFGALRNEWSWRQLSLSVNISYKGSYYFRRSSVNYTALLNTWTGHGDYARRWQQPGDERTTNVPSLRYPNDLSNRDNFYAASAALVTRADHLRLEDLRLSYQPEQPAGKQWWRQLTVFAYVNLNTILWRSNKEGIDPYYVDQPVPGKSFSIGISIVH